MGLEGGCSLEVAANGVFVVCSNGKSKSGVGFSL